MQEIKFGTSGWRDIIAEGFTSEGVAALTLAVARYLKEKKIARQGVVVGHDSRFLAERFSRQAAEILSQEGIDVHLIDPPTPTPVIGNLIREKKLAGGINFTASHNPAEYQGFKWSNAAGGPATKEEVKPIEEEANRILQAPRPTSRKQLSPGRIAICDPKPAYLRQLKKVVPFDLLRKAVIPVVADPLYGAGIGYLDTILENAGCRVTVMHHWRDPLFGGGNPEPDVERLQEAIAVMKKSRSKLVLATDGDADRFGIVDRDGTFLTPNQILGITLYLLVKHRRWEGRVVRSIVTSHFVDRVAGYFGLPVEEVPVGFKYIGESMQHKGFLLGGEESGGLTIQGHLPEKDGILACLLMTELVAREKRSLGEILKSLYALTGKVHSGRINVRLKTKFSGKILADKLESFKPKQLGGMAVNEIVRLDGTKYLLDDRAWLAFRLSGTEPVARLYAEAGSAAQLSRIMKAGQELLAGV